MTDNSLIQGPEVGLLQTQSGDGERFAMALPNNPCRLFLCKLSPCLTVEMNAWEDTTAHGLHCILVLVLLSSSVRTWIFFFYINIQHDTQTVNTDSSNPSNGPAESQPQSWRNSLAAALTKTGHEPWACWNEQVGSSLPALPALAQGWYRSQGPRSSDIYTGFAKARKGKWLHRIY